MECRETMNSLSDYLDGDLWMTDDELQAIEDHLVACPACQSVKQELTELKAAARELPVHTPPRAMWARIVNAIEADVPAAERPTREELPPLRWWERLLERKFTFSLPQLAGASALTVALVLFGIFGVSRLNPGALNISGVQTALLPDEDEIKAGLERKLAAINARKANWDAQARADFDQQLTKIEESLTHCRALLQENPNDKVHQQMVRNLYQEKRQLLEDVERLKW